MGKKMPMSATESNNTCTISSSLIHIKTKKREKKTEKFFYHLQIKTSKDYAEYMASIGRFYCTQCTHKELQGIIYPYLSVSYIYFTHTLHLQPFQLCVISIFTFLIAMQHETCIIQWCIRSAELRWKSIKKEWIIEESAGLQRIWHWEMTVMVLWGCSTFHRNEDNYL